MNLLNPQNIWQAQNLPEGLAFHNGVISGTPTETGSFSIPVSVSNLLGSSTKNISIIVKNRPGTAKFPILQNGSEIEKVTIPQLQAMVQNGTAQEKYNCTNTQIVLPFTVPDIDFYFTYNPEDEDGNEYIVYYIFTKKSSTYTCQFLRLQRFHSTRRFSQKWPHFTILKIFMELCHLL